MTHGSLFSGIGGFDLAASWLGWENVFQCEIDPFCQRVLKYFFTESELLTDIKTTDFRKYYGTIDVISGGFPCQPFSVAGKRKGKDDDRYLWPEMLRCIREVNPSWVIAENVRGLITQGHGMVFEGVRADLEDIGYEVQPFIIPACAVNAPHQRYRVWIIAHRNSNDAGRRRLRETGCQEGAVQAKEEERERFRDKFERTYEERAITNRANAGAESVRESTFGTYADRFASDTTSKRHKERPEYQTVEHLQNNWFSTFPTQSPICSGDDGISDRLDGITFPRWKRESIKSYGNAIVPQIAYQIFKAIDNCKNL